ncbi:IclR family transcriptional regulator [Halovulum sp. GXIMD14793]
MTTKPQRGVQSVDTGGALLRELAASQTPMMLRDLAEAMGTAPAQLHPYLVSFKAMEMVEQTPNGRYQLGPLALQLGLARLQRTDSYRETLDRIGALARELELMVSLAVWGLHGPVITYVRESPLPLHVNIRVGGHYAMLGTATGKVFAAYLSSEVTHPLIAREERQIGTVRNYAARNYAAQVDQVRKQGFSTTIDQPIPGISAIAAPVFDHTGQLQHCLTVIGNTGRIDLSADGHHVQTLLAFAKKRSKDLGFALPAKNDTAG